MGQIQEGGDVSSENCHLEHGFRGNILLRQFSIYIIKIKVMAFLLN